MKRLIIEKQKLKSNISATRDRAGGIPLCGVLKSDAYGLGLIPVARIMRDEGIRFFAVSEPEDAAALRREGFTDEDILLLRSTADPHEIEMLLDYNVIATVGSQEAAMALAGIAERRSTVAEAHIKVDTGLGRYGFLPSESDKIASVVQYMQSIAVSGIYTYLDAHASSKNVAKQIEAFQNVLNNLHLKNIEIGLAHSGGSTALFRYKDISPFGMVRAGASISGRIGGKTGLQKIGTAAAQIAEVRWIPAGHTVSRGKKLKKPARVGIVPLGYADGFGLDRPAARVRHLGRFLKLSDEKSYVRLGSGDKLKLLGTPGQNHIALDLTKSDAAVGTTVYADVDPLFAARLPKEYL